MDRLGCNFPSRSPAHAVMRFTRTARRPDACRPGLGATAGRADPGEGTAAGALDQLAGRPGAFCEMVSPGPRSPTAGRAFGISETKVGKPRGAGAPRRRVFRPPRFGHPCCVSSREGGPARSPRVHGWWAPALSGHFRHPCLRRHGGRVGCCPSTNVAHHRLGQYAAAIVGNLAWPLRLSNEYVEPP